MKMCTKYMQKHKSVIDNAIEMFVEYGYNNVTVEQICNEAKIGKTTFYYHFKSKEDSIIDFLQTFKILINYTENLGRSTWRYTLCKSRKR